jgi:hypothetical protein
VTTTGRFPPTWFMQNRKMAMMVDLQYRKAVNCQQEAKYVSHPDEKIDKKQVES